MVLTLSHLLYGRGLNLQGIVCPILSFCCLYQVCQDFSFKEEWHYLFEVIMAQIFKMEEVQQLFSFRNVEWNFIPPAINWWGGAYERIKRCVKPCLEKVLCRNAAMGKTASNII